MSYKSNLRYMDYDVSYNIKKQDILTPDNNLNKVIDSKGIYYITSCNK